MMQFRACRPISRRSTPSAIPTARAGTSGPLRRRPRARVGGPALPDAVLAHRIADRIDRLLHLVGTDRADAADAERFDLRELARVEDEALVADAVVELLERVRRVDGRMERQDDRRLHLR